MDNLRFSNVELSPKSVKADGANFITPQSRLSQVRHFGSPSGVHFGAVRGASFCDICKSAECCKWKKKLKCRKHINALSMKYAKKNRRKVNRAIRRWRKANPIKYKRSVARSIKKHPWSAHLYNAMTRCNCKTVNKYEYYGGRGIKCFLTREDIVFLWGRDKASKMKQPSLDRKDSDGHYTLENCQFIEMEVNRVNRRYLRNERT